MFTPFGAKYINIVLVDNILSQNVVQMTLQKVILRTDVIVNKMELNKDIGIPWQPTGV